MNQMPTDWLEQIKREYPKRSGPMRWPRVFLPVRRALLETSWDSIMEGVRRYAKYCKDSGKEGSDYVTGPENFFKDEIYLEELEFHAAEDPKITRAAAVAVERMDRAVADGKRLFLAPHPNEPVAAFETRIMLEKQKPPRLRIAK